jgi:hypothetical protein
MTQDEMWELALKTSDKFLRHGLKEARKAGYNIEYNEETQEFTCTPPNKKKGRKE